MHLEKSRHTGIHIKRCVKYHSVTIFQINRKMLRKESVRVMEKLIYLLVREHCLLLAKLEKRNLMCYLLV